MPTSARTLLARRSPAAAAVFAALGDPTRLALVGRLCDGSRQSIAQLGSGLPITRQAVSKHLAILHGASVVSSRREGRESLYMLNREPIEHLRSYIDLVSSQWDDTLSRLKRHVES